MAVLLSATLYAWIRGGCLAFALVGAVWVVLRLVARLATWSSARPASPALPMAGLGRPRRPRLREVAWRALPVVWIAIGGGAGLWLQRRHVDVLIVTQTGGEARVARAVFVGDAGGAFALARGARRWGEGLDRVWVVNQGTREVVVVHHASSLSSPWDTSAIQRSLRGLRPRIPAAPAGIFPPW
jgi:hypothetical protein